VRRSPERSATVLNGTAWASSSAASVQSMKSPFSAA
jgi:hypothetical protein